MMDERRYIVAPKHAHVTHCEDGSTLVAWVYEDIRFSVSIEPEVQDSFWTVVSRGGGGWSGNIFGDADPIHLLGDV